MFLSETDIQYTIPQSITLTCVCIQNRYQTVFYYYQNYFVFFGHTIQTHTSMFIDLVKILVATKNS